MPEPDQLDWINKYPTHVRCLYVDGMRKTDLINIHSSFLSLKHKDGYKAPSEVHEKRIAAALRRALRISNLEEDGRQERFYAVIRDEPGSSQFVGEKINQDFFELKSQKGLMKPTLIAALEAVQVSLPYELNDLILEFSIWSERPIKPIP